VTKSSAGQDFADMEDAIVAAIAQLVRGAAPDAATQAKLIQRAVGIADEAFPGKRIPRSRSCGGPAMPLEKLRMDRKSPRRMGRPNRLDHPRNGRALERVGLLNDRAARGLTGAPLVSMTVFSEHGR
jgi:hypothetical protein